jgi:hypothetical protein
MLVNKPPKFNAREASIADKDKGRAKRPNEIWSSKFGNSHQTGSSLAPEDSPARRRRSRRHLFHHCSPASTLQALFGSKLPILNG